MSDIDHQVIIKALEREACRIEEDCIYSGKSHYNAASDWNHVHQWLGIIATVLAALAGAAILKDFFPIEAGIISVFVALLTALMTFLKPNEKANSHKSAGDQYNSLKNQLRMYREIDLLHFRDSHALRDKLKDLSDRRDKLNQTSPQTPRKAFEQARDGIEAGESTYETDKKEN